MADIDLSHNSDSGTPRDPALESIDLDSPEDREEFLQLIASRTWHGPLPPPEALAAFNRVLPGLSDRIMTMAEKASDHRREMEGGDQTLRSRGQIFAVIIAVFGISAAVVVAMFAPPWTGGVVGTVLGGGTLGGIIYAFITGKHPSDRKRSKDSN